MTPRRGKKRERRPPSDAVITFAIVELWRCADCGRRFKRVHSLKPFPPPPGYQVHARSCRKKARRYELDAVAVDEEGGTP